LTISRKRTEIMAHPRPIRRVVTGDDEQGRSGIVADGPSPATYTIPSLPGFISTNIWVTTPTPAPITAADRIQEHRGVCPPRGGTVIRIIDFPPEPADPAEAKRLMVEVFQRLYPDANHHPEDKHPGMHRTDTIDYAIMLEGELVAILDTVETVLKAGDVLVQRGTHHAWANRSGAPARIAFILVDGKRK
jgi:hypothetical protein